MHRYNKKIESLNYEYNHMLSQTLENQRTYFEKRLYELNQEEVDIIEKRKGEVRDMEMQLMRMDEDTKNVNVK